MEESREEFLKCALLWTSAADLSVVEDFAKKTAEFSYQPPPPLRKSAKVRYVGDCKMQYL